MYIYILRKTFTSKIIIEDDDNPNGDLSTCVGGKP